MLRKIDFYTQLVLVTITSLFILSGVIYAETLIIGLLALIPLGIIQLISAIIYSSVLLRDNSLSYLKIYWILALSSLVLLTACFVLNGSSNWFMLFFIAACIAGYAAAIHYLFIYKKRLMNYKFPESR